MIKLLLVEDDETLSYIEKHTLEEILGGYSVRTAINGKEGLKVYKEFKPDVIVSDIDMPVMNGIEMVKNIRETDGDTVILFATALTNAKDVESGYEVGVNNYVKKPFVTEELNAHIRGLLKMKGGQKMRNETDCCKLGKFTFDAAHSVLRNNETGEKTLMTAMETQILQILSDNRNDIVRREVIQSRCWGKEGNDFFVSRSLDVFVSKLRKILREDDNIELRTIRKIGLALFVYE